MEPEVTIAQGRLRGRTDGNVTAFLGIPYAAAPVGPARFALPAPAAKWDGVRDATSFGPTAPQAPLPPPMDVIIGNPHIDGDDYLNLCVWTPDTGAAGLPVMVWIHGGGYHLGSNAMPGANGTAFARDGIVLVSINYRLGVHGFAVLPDVPANRGIRDQLAALRWVQENIAAFGGDPANVTVFGESAGAMATSTLLSLKASDGLFHRVIAQSGHGHLVGTYEDTHRMLAELSGRLGSPATAASLAKVDDTEITAALDAILQDLAADPDPARWGRSITTWTLPFPPVVDDLITDRPVDTVAAGGGQRVPLMIGTNTDEWRLFVVPSGIAASLTRETLDATAAQNGWDPAIVDHYATNRPEARPGDLLAAILTDSYFRAPAVRLADVHSATGLPTYVYEFGFGPDTVGAAHGREIGYVFDNLPPTAPEQARPVADAMHKAWISFATNGNPGWQPYESTSRPIMLFDAPDSTLIHNPRADELALWNSAL
ncbi:carboxylesterase family protein [Fodinicola feengrottensis]|uniref:Carboxylic ester hydrolase n=1 Tax=Fodinicola feengrottensis TaxID=435914 RepID=A0ABP4SSG7_9ACTN